MLIALINILDEPCFESVSFGSRVYDPIKDIYTSTGSDVRVMRVKWSESYEYLSVGTTAFLRGDIQVFLPKTVAVKPSDLLALSDGSWKILSVQAFGSNVWRCHCRRA